MNSKYYLPICCGFILLANVAFGQSIFTKNGKTLFFSTTSVEDIKATNNQTICLLNLQTGELQFSILNKGFRFRKALMEEHFNENYIESNKYPKSTFKGTLLDIDKINFTKDGVYAVTAIGDLFIHGITQKVSAVGNMNISKGLVTIISKFKIVLSDYNISIPKTVLKNISPNIEISINCNLDQKR
ncbi:MAG: YceI family protein [Ferruginibacter sp.]|nr:YceI family protein [Ferruginibacter sp.]